MKTHSQNFTDEYLNLLVETIEKNPQDLGYQFDRWTAYRLSVYLKEKTGIKLTSNQMRKLLVAKNYIKTIT